MLSSKASGLRPCSSDFSRRKHVRTGAELRAQRSLVTSKSVRARESCEQCSRSPSFVKHKNEWGVDNHIERRVCRWSKGARSQAHWCFERSFPLTPPSPLGRGRIVHRAFANPEGLDSSPRGIR